MVRCQYFEILLLVESNSKLQKKMVFSLFCILEWIDFYFLIYYYVVIIKYQNKNMFDQFKNIAKVKQMQDEMKKETVQSEKDGVYITINGNFELIDVKLNPELSIQEQQKAIIKCYDSAKQEIQKKMISKLGGMF